MKTSTRTSKSRFTGHDRRRLGKALTQAVSAALYRRIQAVWLVASGRSRKEAAHLTRQTDRSVRRQVKRYLRSRSVQSLADRARSGRPRQRDVLTRRRLQALLARSPMALGYRSNVWTCRTLAQHVAERYKVQLSTWTIRRRLREFDYAFKRPRYFYAEKDPHRAQKKPPLSVN